VYDVQVFRALPWLLSAALVVGCGRLGFEVRDAAADGAATDGTAADGAPVDSSRDGGASPVVPTTVGWVLRVGGPSFDTVNGIGVDGDGNVVLGGQTPGGADLGEGPIVVDGGTDSWVASYDRDGALNWVQMLHGVGDDEIFGLHAHADGSVYAVGGFDATMQVGAEVLPTTSARDGFIVAFEQDGAVRWARGIGDDSADDLYFSVTTDADGNVYVSGWINGSVDVGGETLTSTAGEQDAVIVSYDREGALRFATKVGGDSLDQGRRDRPRFQWRCPHRRPRERSCDDRRRRDRHRRDPERVLDDARRRGGCARGPNLRRLGLCQRRPGRPGP
jgi:hypothetical protein